MKLKVPSDDDCIERKGADGPCQNSKCHWHRYGYALHCNDGVTCLQVKNKRTSDWS